MYFYIRILDSYKLLSASLDKLSKNLNDNQLIHTKRFFKGCDIDLVKKKGIYPYEYINCCKRFEETCLPSKDCFYSNLNECEINDKDYEHALNVFNKFSLKNLGEYHDLYLKCDVSLLLDVICAF